MREGRRTIYWVTDPSDLFTGYVGSTGATLKKRAQAQKSTSLSPDFGLNRALISVSDDKVAIFPKWLKKKLEDDRRVRYIQLQSSATTQDEVNWIEAAKISGCMVLNSHDLNLLPPEPIESLRLSRFFKSRVETSLKEGLFYEVEPLDLDPLAQPGEQDGLDDL